MPNWCENVLTVTGDDAELARFREFAQGVRTYQDAPAEKADMLFNNFVPLPDDLSEYEGEHIPAWFAFRVANWGTKWEPSCVSVEASEGRLHYEFDTAWSPPLAVIAAASTQFPRLCFDLSYLEIQLGYRGEFWCCGGVAVKDYCEDFDPFADEMQDSA